MSVMARKSAFSNLAALGCLLAITSQASSQALRPLNLVLVTIDTLRPDHLHCYGYSKIETPTIDSLRRQAVSCSKTLSPRRH